MLKHLEKGIVKIMMLDRSTIIVRPGPVTVAPFNLTNKALSIIARCGVIRQKHAGLVVIFSIRPANMEVIARHGGLSGKGSRFCAVCNKF